MVAPPSCNLFYADKSHDSFMVIFLFTDAAPVSFSKITSHKTASLAFVIFCLPLRHYQERE
jgi:hypothetical protein